MCIDISGLCLTPAATQLYEALTTAAAARRLMGLTIRKSKRMPSGPLVIGTSSVMLATTGLSLALRKNRTAPVDCSTPSEEALLISEALPIVGPVLATSAAVAAVALISAMSTSGSYWDLNVKLTNISLLATIVSFPIIIKSPPLQAPL